MSQMSQVNYAQQAIELVQCMPVVSDAPTYNNNKHLKLSVSPSKHSGNSNMDIYVSIKSLDNEPVDISVLEFILMPESDKEEAQIKQLDSDGEVIFYSLPQKNYWCGARLKVGK